MLIILKERKAKDEVHMQKPLKHMKTSFAQTDSKTPKVDSVNRARRACVHALQHLRQSNTTCL